MYDDYTYKIYCANCDCVVVPLAHEDRCRPKSLVGWDVKRRCAWIGDAVHRLDVTVAVMASKSAPELWENQRQMYTSNAAQAQYMRELDAGLSSHGDHSLGTEFESRYFGLFRKEYLAVTFPNFHQLILMQVGDYDDDYSLNI